MSRFCPCFWVAALAFALGGCEPSAPAAETTTQPPPASIGDGGSAPEAAGEDASVGTDTTALAPSPDAKAGPGLKADAGSQVDTAPTDTAPTDTAPTDTAPTDTAPTDTAPSDTGPAATAPAANPAEPFGPTLTKFVSCTIAFDQDQLPSQVPTSAPAVTTAAGAGDTLTDGHPLQVFGSELFVADSANGALVVLDRTTLAIVRTVPVGAGAARVAIDCTGAAWVTCQEAGTLVRVDAGASVTAAKWTVGKGPVGLALRSGMAGCAPVEVVVTLSAERALVGLAAGNGAELWRTPVPARPGDLVVSGTAAVAGQQGGPPVRVVLPTAGAGASTPPAAQALKLRTANPGHAVALSNSQKLPVLAAVGIGVVARGAAPGEVLVGHSLAALGQESSLLPKPQQPPPPPAPYGAPAPLEPGSDPCQQLPIRPLEASVTRIVQGVATATAKSPVVQDPKTWRNFLARFDQPSGLRLHPSRSLGLMTARGTDNVLLLNTGYGDPMRFPMGVVQVGHGPAGIAFSPDGKLAYVRNEHAMTISEINLDAIVSAPVPAPGKVVPTSGPLFLLPARTAPYGTDPLSPELRAGRHLFHFAADARVSRTGRLACASCHPGGTEDGLVWTTAVGPRQTPGLVGRLQDTGPFGWNGEHNTLIAKMLDTMPKNLQGKGGLLAEEMVALEKWLLHTPPPAEPTSLTPSQQKGKDLFEDPVVACTNCHGAPTYTNGLLHNVGTATAVEKQLVTLGLAPAKLNTPSLRGLRDSAPYLHDGSAATLLEVLDKTANAMGKTSHLSAGQKADLVAYLLTL